jgi:hypothetical protein
MICFFKNQEFVCYQFFSWRANFDLNNWYSVFCVIFIPIATYTKTSTIWAYFKMSVGYYRKSGDL